MKDFIKRYLRPLNLFEIHGNFCCQNMFEAFEQSFSSSFCFNAVSLAEANFLLLWGSFSEKLVKSIEEPINLGAKKYIVHIQGCSQKDLAKHLPVNLSVTQCQPDFEALLKEARRCLKA